MFMSSVASSIRAARDAFRVTDGVLDRNGVRDADEGEAIDVCRRQHASRSATCAARVRSATSQSEKRQPSGS